MTHLTREELVRWWKDGPPAERERIVSHLAVCDECGALYGERIDAQPVAADSRPDLAALGYGAYRRPRRLLPSPWSVPTLAAAATAAVLLIGLAIVALRAPEPPDDASGIRGTSLQPLSPIGRVDPPVVFRWESPVRASSYRVEVRDSERRMPVALYYDAESVGLPPPRPLELTPGEEYTWEVVALGPDGEEIMRSPARGFSVSPRPR
jgi:hypothetical protein